MLGCSNSNTAVDSIENYFSSMGPGHVDRVWVLPGTDLAQVDRVVAAAKAVGSRVFFSLADANGRVPARAAASRPTGTPRGGGRLTRPTSAASSPATATSRPLRSGS